jgi:hypothetical protein
MFGWTPATLQQPELDFSKWDYKPFEPQSTDELVEYLDKNVAEAIDVLKEHRRRSLHGKLDDAERRPDLFHDAQNRRNALVRNEPYRSSSRPTFSLSAFE